MRLCDMLKASIVAVSLSGCAAQPKAVCSYEGIVHKCLKEYEDAVVEYKLGTSDGGEACSLYVKYKDGYLMGLIDLGCDGTVDIFAERESGKTQMALRDENEEYFRDNFDRFVKDSTFDEMRKGGRKK